MSDGNDGEMRFFANKKEWDMDGYVQKQFEGKTKRYVQILELLNDPDMIKEYRKWHSEEFHWKEIQRRHQGCGHPLASMQKTA